MGDEKPRLDAHGPKDLPPAQGGQSEIVQELADRLFAAQQSTETEVKMSLWEALKLYPKASMWSLLISFAVVMEGEWLQSRHGLLSAMYTNRTHANISPGYDVILIGSFCKFLYSQHQSISVEDVRFLVVL